MSAHTNDEKSLCFNLLAILYVYIYVYLEKIIPIQFMHESNNLNACKNHKINLFSYLFLCLK